MGRSAPSVGQSARISALLLAACSNLPPAAKVPPPDLTTGAPLTDAGPSREFYCSALTYLWDTPRCLHEITPEQQRARGWSLRVRVEGGRVTDTQMVNGRGLPIDTEQEYATLRYRYEGRRAVEWEVRNRNGAFKRLTRFVGARHEVALWLDEKGRRMAWRGTRAVGMRRDFDEHGRVIKEAYFDAGVRPTTNENGVAIVRYRFDDTAARLDESFFDPYRDQPASNDRGVHRIVHDFDRWREATSRSYFGTDGNPINGPRGGFHRVRFQRDAANNCIAWAYFDTQGAPVVAREDGVAAGKRKLNAYGSETRVDYLGPKGEPMTSVWGFASREQTLDDNEDAVEWRHFQTEGQLAPRNFGHAILRQVRDVRGNVVEDHFLDARGAPIRTREGYAQVRRKYDDGDVEVRTEYFDETGNRVLSTFGFHARVTERDDGREVRTRLEGLHGEPAISTEGFASLTTTYDEAGAIAKIQFFDAAGAVAQPRVECPGMYDRSAEQQLVQELSKLRSCGAHGGPPSLVLRLGINARGRALGFDPIGPGPSPTTRECLRRDLGTLALPSNYHHCTNVIVELPFDPPGPARVKSFGDETAKRLPPG